MTVQITFVDEKFKNIAGVSFTRFFDGWYGAYSNTGTTQYFPARNIREVTEIKEKESA